MNNVEYSKFQCQCRGKTIYVQQNDVLSISNYSISVMGLPRNFPPENDVFIFGKTPPFLCQNFRRPHFFGFKIVRDPPSKTNMLKTSLYSVQIYMHKKRIYFSYLDTCIEILEDPSFLSIFLNTHPFLETEFTKTPPDFCRGAPK